MRSVHNLKRDLLLFDRIQVMGLDWQIGGDATDRGLPVLDDATAADCEYLIERGVLADAPAFREDVARYVSEALGDKFELAEAWDGVTPLSSTSPTTQGRILVSSARHPAGVIPWDQALPAGSEIVVAIAMSLFDPTGVVAVLEQPVSKQIWQQITGTFLVADQPGAERNSMVVEVVLPRVPTPGDDVSLEAIMDFR